MAGTSLFQARVFSGERYRCDVRLVVVGFLIDRLCRKRRTSVAPIYIRYVADEEAAYQLRPKAKDRSGRTRTSRALRRAFAPRRSILHRPGVKSSFSEPASPHSRRPQVRS